MQDARKIGLFARLLEQGRETGLKGSLTGCSDLGVHDIPLGIDEQRGGQTLHMMDGATIDIQHHREGVAILLPEPFGIL